MTGEEYWKQRHLYLVDDKKGGFKKVHFDKDDKPVYTKCDYAWGVYVVDIIHIPKHIIPLLPQKNSKGHTCWDLVCRKEQHYTTIDLEEGVKKVLNSKLYLLLKLKDTMDSIPFISILSLYFFDNFLIPVIKCFPFLIILSHFVLMRNFHN